jgi:hypothetical protein
MARSSLLLWLVALSGLSLASGCCCSPCLRMPCINELDRYYPGSDDCLNGGPCGDPEDVGGMQTGMANCETCARQKELTGGCNTCGGGGCSRCGEWFPWMRGFTGGGCGRFYWDEWWSDPPCRCEPCDLNGNYCGGQGICRAWRLGLPMPMMSRGCCGANPAACGGSALSCWAKNRRTCWSGCFSPCRTTCNTCTSGTCHIDSLGYDAAGDSTCASCQSGGTMPSNSVSPTPAAPVPAPPAPANGATGEKSTSVMPTHAAPVVASRPPTKMTTRTMQYSPARATTPRTAAKAISAPQNMTSTRRG